MKKPNGIVWGLVLIAAGVIFALNALEITDINVFFPGWWTLILIIPCAVGLFSEREKTGNLIGLLVGVALLLACQGVLSFGVLWKLLIPVLIILIGCKMVFGNLFGGKKAERIKELKDDGETLHNGTAAFSGLNLNFDGQVFEGAELNAVFGGVKCDLTGAIFEKDCLITASAIFGNVTILVPGHINVQVKSGCLFGGVSDKTHRKTIEGAVTLYVDGTAMFGGVEIR